MAGAVPLQVVHAQAVQQHQRRAARSGAPFFLSLTQTTGFAPAGAPLRARHRRLLEQFPDAK